MSGPRSLGKGMILAAWVVLIGLLTLLFQQRMEQADNPNQQLEPLGSKGQGLVLRRNRAGHYVAPGEINGRPVSFLVDTGATEIAIPERVARRLGLPKGATTQTITANGQAEVWNTRLDRVRLGPILQHRLPAVILPNMPGDQVLLGMRFLRPLELLQRDDQLQIRMGGQ